MTEIDPNAGRRRVLTTAGGLLLAVGVVFLLWGAIGFGSGVFGDVPDGTPMGRYFAFFALGAFGTVIGFGLLSAGTLRAQSRYVATETADAVRTTSGVLAEGLGLRKEPSRFCSHCGGELASGAAFCSSCGTAVG